MGVLEHRKRPVHPGVDVAFHGDEFHLVVLIHDGRCARRLRFVPLAVDLGERMDVMRGLIFVENLEWLGHLKRKDVRYVTAALLGEYRRWWRRRLFRGS